MTAAAVANDAPAAARQMSWAERAKASVHRPDLTKSTSPTPSNSSNTASSASNPLSEPNKSITSGLQNGLSSAFHKRSGSDFATTAPVAPLPVEDTPATSNDVVVASPARPAPVNVWKERMAAAATQKVTAPTPIVTPERPPMLPSEQRSPVMTNGKVSGRGRPIAPAQVPPPALTDTTNWPSPIDAEKGKVADEVAVKMRAADTSPSATSSRSSGGQETGKSKKTKWIPIEADITIDAPLPTRYLKDGERSRPGTRSQSREAPRLQQSALPNTLPRVESQPLSAGVPAFPMPAPAMLPTSLPAKPLGMSTMAMAPTDGSMSMRASSPRMMMNGASSPTESLRSPSSPTAPLSRSMSGSSAGRASSVAGSSSGRIESNRVDVGAFGQSRGSAPLFSSNTRGRGNGRVDGAARGSVSPRGNQGSFGRGGGRGGFRGGRGGSFANVPPHAMAQMPYFEGGYVAPYGYMQQPFLPQGMPQQNGAVPRQQQQQSFNMMPMMQALPPAPYKTDYMPPLDPTRFYLLGQLEFYLSPDNLARDLFLRQQMDTEGWIDMKTVLTFKRITCWTNSLELMRDTLMLSPLIDVDYERYKFRTKHEWARWIMPDAKQAEPPVTTSNGHLHPDSYDLDHEDGSKSHSASEDGETTGTTGLTSPSLSSQHADQQDELPAKAEAGAHRRLLFGQSNSLDAATAA